MDSGRWEEVRAAAVRMEELRLGDPEGWLLLRELVERLTEQEDSMENSADGSPQKY
ncbi:MAG: hypothetical protein HFF16_08715 [Angelakisella sp.]|mgnify:CR=1 FL=1|jgi:hypothetical protein|nr:hypothetical protein [Angelakisella sp.]